MTKSYTNPETDETKVRALLERLQRKVSELRVQRSGIRTNVDEKFVLASRQFLSLSQMKGASTRQEAIATVKDILTNFIGTEQFACLLFQKGQTGPNCLFSMGVGDDQLASLRSDTQAFTDTVAEKPPGVVAVVPLRLREEVVGAIVVFGLLPQKNNLENVDYALFDLLTEHAAASIVSRREAIVDVRKQ